MFKKSAQIRVLFAHQSTIPHYRIPLYEMLERLRPESWGFDVVFDLAELENPQFFHEPINIEEFGFPLLNVKTLTLQIRGKKISYQTFWRRAADYDLLIVGHSINNLAYPFCQVHQLVGNKFAYWGHGWDHAVNHNQMSLPKKIIENLKLLLARQADGFFAYTPGVKDYLVQEGLSPQRIFVVNNTIDINEQRRLLEHWLPQRRLIRQQLNLHAKKTLLFVGRFTQNKRIDFLLKALTILQSWEPDYHLLLVGSGGKAYSIDALPNVTYLGPIVESNQLAKIYVASDLFSFPGSVGLGPLQALCYDLPVVTIESNIQMPEFEYLNNNNSIILPLLTTPEIYARAIFELFDDQEKLRALRSGVWPSIKHRSIEQMALNFIRGIDSILAT